MAQIDAIAFIQRLGGGHALDEFFAKVLQASEEVVATKKPATATLKVKIEPIKEGPPTMVLYLEEASNTLPKKDPLGAHAFVHDGLLQSDDPQSDPLPGFRVVIEKQTMRTPEEPGESIREAE